MHLVMLRKYAQCNVPTCLADWWIFPVTDFLGTLVSSATSLLCFFVWPLVSPVPMQCPRMQPALRDRPIVDLKQPVPLFAVAQMAGVGCGVLLVPNGLEKAQSSFVQIAASSH